jgi:hypothetical protein
MSEDTPRRFPSAFNDVASGRHRSAGPGIPLFEDCNASNDGNPIARMVADQARTAPLTPVLAIGAFAALARIAEYPANDGDTDGLSS